MHDGQSGGLGKDANKLYKSSIDRFNCIFMDNFIMVEDFTDLVNAINSNQYSITINCIGTELHKLCRFTLDTLPYVLL